MISILITLINVFVQVYTLLIIVSSVLSFFMSPYDPIRLTVDRFINPLLNPIRRIMPPMGAFDFSPLVLLILIQILGQILVTLLASIR